ncbi:NAD(P)-dependent dehydrogenase (short-subunit alcohol dehydrogenase family) [Bosea sp. OAE752]|jgi:NAD(P)-dependent dehydrogenase (short-subunit alcohol dehydrogenase family)|uniref:SDR family NAD(P)-dependent oxidoreductase n=1 Tax=unclassified Bosea (in: a-proteobacteria) TaxID=2653178 RepID=UPI0011513D7F
MTIDGAVFLVTGASSGLGETVARALVARGAQVVAVDVNAEAGEAVARDLGANAKFVRTDVTKIEDAANAVSETLARFGRLNGLVNCAGVAPGERILSKSGPHRLESFARAVEINVVGTFNMLRLAAEAIAKNEPAGADGERGVIINTASIAAFDGQIGQAAYAASKGAVAALTLPAARELAQFGIRVVTIAPGIFQTPMMAAIPEPVQAALGATVPFPKRLGRPSEYAALVAHICENPMLNGEVIRLDGALRMAPR